MQGQTVLIQGGGPGAQGQTFMLQNAGQQSQVSIITTSLSQSSTTQSIQIVQQQQQQPQTKLNQSLQGENFKIVYVTADQKIPFYFCFPRHLFLSIS